MNYLQPSNRAEPRDPFQDMQMMLRQAFGPMANDDSSDIATSQWMPRVDIVEEDNRFLIKADIPGVDPKDIEVQMDQGVLTIKGERNEETKEETERGTRLERQHGAFYRRFALPESADPEGIKATGKNGVLEIDIPKQPVATPRRIQVS